MIKLSLTVADVLARLRESGVEATFHGDESTPITGFSDPRNYLPHTVIWAGKPEDIVLPEGMTNRDVALLMVKEAFTGMGDFPNIAVLADPRNVFMALVSEFCGTPVPARIESTAVVDPGAVVGKNAYVGHYAVIEDGVVIGENCVIHQGAFLGRGTVLGDFCVVGHHAVLAGASTGSVYYDREGNMKNMPNVGGVRLGRNVQIGPNCDIGSGTFFETVIEDDCVLNSNCSVGHNCKIGRGAMLLGRCTIHGNTVIGSGCELISATVKNRVTIGEGAKVGIGSVIIQDVPAGKVVFGNPARTMGDNQAHRR